MKLRVEQSIKIEDGTHQGVIARIDYRTVPYSYVDLIIMTKETGTLELRAGFPTFITPESKLGLLLQKFGALMTVGNEIDIETFLLNKPIIFMTIKKKGKTGREYAEVIQESIKPLPLVFQ